MEDPLLPPSITLRELNRQPGEILDRVRHGERIVVRRYGKPIATLQPIDGFVLDPICGSETDICGNPLGDISSEVTKLSKVEKDLIDNSHHLMNRITIGCSDAGATVVWQAMESLVLRGFLEKTSGGLILTGRGLMIREWLHSRKRG